MIVIKEQKIARNFVARAVAAQQLKKRMIDQRIQLFVLDEGDDAKAHLMPIADAVFIMAYALEMIGQKDSLEHRKLRSAMNVLVDCSERQFKWQKIDTVTIDNAIDICVNQWTKVPSEVFQDAVNHILGTMSKGNLP